MTIIQILGTNYTNFGFPEISTAQAILKQLV